MTYDIRGACNDMVARRCVFFDELATIFPGEKLAYKIGTLLDS